ncbi:MAG: hypothetical protein GY869_01790 [Planctomycetes bacterium]|nr:hypothetical protein [Planctomycetota bacterium]
MRKLSVLILTVVVSLVMIQSIGAQTLLDTTFTYQGRLILNDSPVHQTCAFQFSLWGSAAGADQVGSTLTRNNVNVTGGLFTVKLAFDTGTFTGEPRWLQIAVDTTETGSFVKLAPRQQVTAAPYALHTRGLFVDDSGQLGIGLENPTAKLHLGGAAGVDGIKFPDGTLQTTAGIAGGSGWNLTGNSGTDPVNNFLGTTDNVPLVLRVNNQPGLRLEPNDVSPNIIGGYHGNSVYPGAVGSVIGGGGMSDTLYGTAFPNLIRDDFCTIGGGFLNSIGVDYDDPNIADYATIGGGFRNTAWGNSSTIAGGQDNFTQGIYSAIGGGQGNFTESYGSTIGGGYSNGAYGHYSTIGGGWGHSTYANYATIAGGGTYPSPFLPYHHRIFDHHGTIGGGGGNEAGSNDADPESAEYATVAGGARNLASAKKSTIGGGELNKASNNYAAVGGGYNNEASGLYATIPGGYGNQASGYISIAAGDQNNASNDYSVVSGGRFHQASGKYATIPGGYDNDAAGDYSFAAGKQAQAAHDGAFVWADNGAATFASTNPNQFLIRAGGGVGIGTDNPIRPLEIQSDQSVVRLTTTNSVSGSVLELHNTKPAPITFLGAINFVDRVGNTPGQIAYRGEDDALTFNTKYANRVIIDADGNVGVGTSSPQAKLEVAGGQTILEQQAWQIPSLLNGWINYGSGYNPTQYFKDSNGIVHLRGVVKNGSIGTTIFNLPAGNRPEFTELQAAIATTSTIARIEILSNGDVKLVVGNAAGISLDGISFRAYN